MNYLRDERGMGMLVEILAGTALLGLIVLAVYSYTTHQNAATTKNSPTPTASQSASSSPTPDPLADWKDYTNAKGSFSLKYPNKWVVNTCDEATFMALSGAGLGKAGKCQQTDGWAHINIMARPLNDSLADQLNNIPANEKVTVDGLTARRTVSTLGVNNDPVYSPPAGTKEIAYIFKSDKHVYWALYVQEPTGASSTDLSADFDRLMQNTFTIND